MLLYSLGSALPGRMACHFLAFLPIAMGFSNPVTTVTTAVEFFIFLFISADILWLLVNAQFVICCSICIYQTMHCIHYALCFCVNASIMKDLTLLRSAMFTKLTYYYFGETNLICCIKLILAECRIWQFKTPVMVLTT